MLKNNIIKKIEYVLSGLEVDICYIFGSFLESNEFEDVDIAVLTHEKLTSYEAFKFSMHIATKLEQEIEPRLEFDVKVLNTCPIDFQYKVISTGRLVFCRNELIRIRYEEEVMGMFLDYSPAMRWFDERFLAEV
ncbi:MAG TPA: nucleotidyltransferase domain-containing protein [Candidatus Methanoperedens sp.]